MKIVICGSMSASRKMLEVKEYLDSRNIETHIPRNIEKYANKSKKLEDKNESVANKIQYDLIRDYYRQIQKADAVLVVNEDKDGTKNYIGGNSFLEMGYAYALNKPIYLLNRIPDMLYTDEIIVFQPVVLNGDLSKISLQ